MIWLCFEGVAVQTKYVPFPHASMTVCQQGTPDRADHMHPCAKIFAEMLAKRYLSKLHAEEKQIPN